MEGRKCSSGSRIARMSAVLFQNPVFRPARNAAPSAVLSVTAGRLIWASRISAWNRTSRLLAEAPPSTLSWSILMPASCSIVRATSAT